MPDCLALRVRDRMAAFLAADADLGPLFTGSIRAFPPNGVDATEGLVLAVTVSEGVFGRDTAGGRGIGTHTLECRLLLIALLHAPDSDNMDAEYRQLMNAHQQMMLSAWKYQSDPTPGDSLWHQIAFARDGGQASFDIQYLPGQYLRAAAALDVFTHQRNP